MSNDLYRAFITTMVQVIKDSKFPTEDAARVFNILISIAPYHFKGSLDEQFEDAHYKFMFELVGRLRHSVYNVPKEHFTSTISNLVEF